MSINERSTQAGVSAAYSTLPTLSITVIETSENGTIAALNAVHSFAKDLGSQVTLLRICETRTGGPPGKCSLDLEFAASHTRELLRRSLLPEAEVAIRTCFCRDQHDALRRLLHRRSVVVLGGAKHWWSSREERLERELRDIGCEVFFIEIGAVSNGSKPGSADRLFRKQLQQSPSNVGEI